MDLKQEVFKLLLKSLRKLVLELLEFGVHLVHLFVVDVLFDPELLLDIRDLLVTMLLSLSDLHMDLIELVYYRGVNLLESEVFVMSQERPDPVLILSHVLLP